MHLTLLLRCPLVAVCLFFVELLAVKCDGWSVWPRLVGRVCFRLSSVCQMTAVTADGLMFSIGRVQLLSPLSSSSCCLILVLIQQRCCDDEDDEDDEDDDGRRSLILSPWFPDFC